MVSQRKSGPFEIPGLTLDPELDLIVVILEVLARILSIEPGVCATSVE